MNGNGGFGFLGVLVTMGAMIVVGLVMAFYYLFVGAVAVVLGMIYAVLQFIHLFKKQKAAKFNIDRAPRPVMTNGLKASPGPRDWSPKEI